MGFSKVYWAYLMVLYGGGLCQSTQLVVLNAKGDLHEYTIPLRNISGLAARVKNYH